MGGRRADTEPETEPAAGRGPRVDRVLCVAARYLLDIVLGPRAPNGAGAHSGHVGRAGACVSVRGLAGREVRHYFSRQLSFLSDSAVHSHKR